MSFEVTSSSNSGFDLGRPPEGPTNMVICEAIDKGIVNTKYGDQHKGILVCQLEHKIDCPESELFHGKPHETWLWFNVGPGLGSWANPGAKKTNLRLIVEAVAGREMPQEVLKKYDPKVGGKPFKMDSLIGKCLGGIGRHTLSSRGQEVTNYDIKSLFKATKTIEIEDYVPVAERGGDKGSDSPSSQDAIAGTEDSGGSDDLPW